MKTVFNNRMVAHVWAQQTQPEGRGSNFYFEGPTLYSYGKHFPIATFHTVKGKGAAVLFTTDRRSVSTSKHCSFARNALHGRDVPIFNVADVGDVLLTKATHNKNREDYKKRIETATAELARGRDPQRLAWRVSEVLGLHAEANRYAEFFSLPWRLKAPDITEDYIAQVKEKAKAATAKQKKAKAAAEKKRAAELAAIIAEWRAGEAVTLPGWGAAVDTMLRIKGEEVETSRGARVPVKDARRACKFVREVKNAGQPWQKNGQRVPVGQFELDSVDTEGNVRAGCHFIKWDEIARLMPALGL